jgi:hypothetical protein
MDYKNFSPNGPAGMDNFEWRRWWACKETEMADAISRTILQLHQTQQARLTQLDMGTRLYGNISIMGLNGLSYSRIVQKSNAIRDRLTYNVIQACIDTVTAKIGKNKPRPLFLTSGGDWKRQQKAKKLNKFVDGIFYENEAYHQGTLAFRNACVWGDGITHVFSHNKRVKHEDVLPHELYVDEVEASRGNPRQMHRVKAVDRMQLVDMFPSKKRKILECGAATYDEVGTYQHISDVIIVRESWHLPSGKDAKDGLRVISINNDVLYKEEWKRDHFPFAFFKWNQKPIGFWGQSVVEQIQNIQLEINKLLWVLQRSYHLAGSFKILLANGSKVVKEHFTNDVGALIYYTGTMPQYITPPIVPVEYYQHLESLIQKAFNEVGVSQLSAGSLKPQGLDSGKAIREYNDIESDRFMTVGRNYQKYYLDLAKLDIETAKEIYEEEGEYKVFSIGKNYTQEIDWEDINLQDDEFVMKEYPVSSLPEDPEGRLATIQEYVQAGMMSPTTARRLLDFPDLEQEENLQNASEEYINKILEEIVEHGDEDDFVYKRPEPYDDLELCLEFGLQYYAQGKTNGLEEVKLQLLRKWIDDVKDLQLGAQMGAQALSQPPAPPQGVPEAAPVSDMIPNVPGAAA